MSEEPPQGVQRSARALVHLPLEVKCPVGGRVEAKGSLQQEQAEQAIETAFLQMTVTVVEMEGLQ